MKFLVLLFSLFIAKAAIAEDRTQLCQYFYKHEIFSRYLHLSVEIKPDSSFRLWMDTPTPYGIRPYTYEVSRLSCTDEGSLHLEAQSTGTTQRVIFNSKNSNLAGKLEYLNSKGETNFELVMECSPEKIKELCSGEAGAQKDI